MLNSVTLIGHLGGDPETLRTRKSGKDYARFSLATSKRRRDQTTGERHEKTQWHKVVVWNEHLVEVVRNYLKKGSKIYIEGELETRKWRGKDGVDRYMTEIVLSGFRSKILTLDPREGERPPEPEDPEEFGSGDYNAAKDGERSIHAELDDEIPL